MSKATPGKGAPSQGGATESTPKAAKLKKGEAFVSDGANIRANGRALTGGDIVTAKDFAIDGETDGQAAFDRLVEGGELTTDAPGTTSQADPDSGAASGVGAGPSAAQIIAALQDPEVRKVVEAGLHGTPAEFTKAADPEAKADDADTGKPKE